MKLNKMKTTVKKAKKNQAHSNQCVMIMIKV